MSKDKKTKTTENSTSNTNMTGATTGTSNLSSTGTAPDWITTALKGITGNVMNLGSANPTSYVAGADPLQTQAGINAAGLTSTPWNYDAALDLTRGVANRPANTYNPTTGMATTGKATDATAASSLDNLSAYYNPFKDQITNPVLADYDHQAGLTRAQQDLDLAHSGAFGGSGAALTKSATEDSLARGRATTESGLLDQMFNTSLGASADDANRRQQVSLANAGAANQFGLANENAANDFTKANMDANNQAGQFNAGQNDTAANRTLASASQLGNLSGALDSSQRADITTQAGIGDALRAITQSKDSAPLDLASWQNSALPSLLSQLFGKDVSGTTSGTSTQSGTTNSSGTTNVSQNPSQAAQAGQVLQVIAALFGGG